MTKKKHSLSEAITEILLNPLTEFITNLSGLEYALLYLKMNYLILPTTQKRIYMSNTKFYNTTFLYKLHFLTF